MWTQSNMWLIINHRLVTSGFCEINMLQDEDICCFRDIKPAAPHHYLVVPTKHVGNCKSLNIQHVPLGKVTHLCIFIFFPAHTVNKLNSPPVVSSEANG